MKRTKKYKGKVTKRNGTTFRSGFEARFDKFLSKRKLPSEYETMSIPYVIRGLHKTDWVFYKHDGSLMFIQLKGVLDKDARDVILGVVHENEGIDYRIVFQRDNKVYKGGKMRYTDWAKKYKIPSFVVTNDCAMLPESWIKEIRV